MVALLVLNYNGIAHLDDCLQTATVSLAESGLPGRIVLVDNGSTDGSIQFVRRMFPHVDVIQEQNRFLCSYNAVAPLCSEDILVLLNNDMRFDKGFVGSLVRPLDAKNVFAVTARVMDWNGTANTTGRRLARVNRLWFSTWWADEPTGACLSLDACGGAMAVRRDRFLLLGGFDPLFLPGYYEDLDLSYRAWRQRWTVVYEPHSVVFHKVGASFSQAREFRRDVLLCRNHILFTIKNIGSLAWCAAFLSVLPWRILGWRKRSQFAWSTGGTQALRMAGVALAARRAAKPLPRVDDGWVLGCLNSGSEMS